MSKTKTTPPCVKNINCIYCNSRSHLTSNCNSNMKGRRKLLIDIGNTFMLDDKEPDFKSFSINELRFIASIYEKLQKTSLEHKMKDMYQYFESKRMIEYLHTPVPVTLTKSRMIKDLLYRWTLYSMVRNNYNHKKPENEDCPICMDCLYIPRWNPMILQWDMVTPKLYSPDALDDGNVVTLCGHIFCGHCWEMHQKVNGKIDYEHNKWNAVYRRMVVCCPLCRQKVMYKEYK